MKKLFLIFGLFCLIFPFVYAEGIEVNINIPKNEYSVGETVSIKISIKAGPAPFSGSLILDYDISEQSEYYQPEPFQEYFEINAGETKEFLLSEYISEINPSGKYTAVAKILDENSQIVKKEEASFNVKGTKKLFEIDLETCKDETCSEKSKTFIKSKIYIFYNASIQSPIIITKLIFPDETTQQISLPYSFEADQIGTYTLEVIASKEGYKTITKKEQFAVIEKHAEIESASVCNANGICDGKENYQNCPQDCVKKEQRYLWLVIISTLALLLIIYLISKKTRKYRPEKKTTPNNAETHLSIYIKNHLKRGFSKNKIKQVLMKAGWKKSQIDSALRKLKVK